MASMSEHPIIMSADSVRAILAGKKTQTRRVVTVQPRQINDDFDGAWEWKIPGHYYDDLVMAMVLRDACPYGQQGDRLWVRETFAFDRDIDEQMAEDSIGPACIDMFSVEGVVFYKADNWTPPQLGKWRSSIRMPRWASRITLEVAKIRVERVQDIGEEDTWAEGTHTYISGLPDRALDNLEDGAVRHTRSMDPRAGSVSWKGEYAAVWDRLNAKRGFPWKSNPWVWAVTFTVAETEHD
jgi:hypothetical protein